MDFDNTIYQTAITQGIPNSLAVLIVAQARHETADYTSNVFQSCNNAFGYKWVGQSTAQGPCAGSSEGNDYAGYSSVEQSTQELTAWIKRRQQEGTFPADLSTITTPEQYAGYLKDADYYGDSIQNYTNGLISALQRLGNALTQPVNLGLILALLALLLYLWNKERKKKKK